MKSTVCRLSHSWSVDFQPKVLPYKIDWCLAFLLVNSIDSYIYFLCICFVWFISLSDTSCSTDYTMQMEYIYIAAIKSTLNSGDVNRAILCFLYVNALPSNLFCHQTSNFSISATCANQHSEYELNHLAYILMPSPSPWKRKKKLRKDYMKVNLSRGKVMDELSFSLRQT